MCHCYYKYRQTWIGEISNNKNHTMKLAALIENNNDEPEDKVHILDLTIYVLFICLSYPIITRVDTVTYNGVRLSENF